jgi:DNA-binding transcriptional regulator PaaX
MMIRAKRVAVFFVLTAVFTAGPLLAQSTLGDPVPLQGNQAESIARTAAINGAMGNGTYTSPAEFARRKQQGQAASNCKKNARNRYPAGDQRRKNLVAQCQRVFEAQRATWYDPAKKLP